VRQLKVAAGERDRRVKTVEVEAQRREADLHDRLEAERSLSKQLQDDLEAALDRKVGLKDEVAELTTALDQSHRNEANARAQADAKTDLLGQVEEEVMELRRKCKAREVELVTENTGLKTLAGRLEAQLRTCAAEFQTQLATAEQQRERLEAARAHVQAELVKAQQQVARGEAELRDMLEEMEKKKTAFHSLVALMAA
jgi:chromosome segregation ATPase